MKRSVTRFFRFSVALNVWTSAALTCAAVLLSAHAARAGDAKFTAVTATMTVPRSGHTATLLPNGEVILIGGENLCCGNGTTYDSAELYDPVANTFTALTATMTTARESYTATLLLNGQVLIAGGFNDNSDCLDTAEVYDPVANKFTPLTATMTTPRCDPAATLLPNGMVLITGGGYDGDTYNTAELYDPMANTFTALSATMTSVRSGHTATLLPNGLVLLTGGVQGSGKGSSSDFNTAEVYDPVANTFTALPATMTTARGLHRAALLPNGQVLLTGGAKSTTGAALNTAELYTSSLLSSAITATDTCIPVSDTSIFSPTGGFALIGTELIWYTGLSTSCSGASAARVSAGTAATAGVLTGVVRNLNGQGGAHAAGTPVTPTAAPCVGDCNGNGTVTVDEILTMVNIALGNARVDDCLAGDVNDDGQITVDEILTAVNNALNGC